MISDLHFLRPWWWLLALPLPLWLAMLARNQRGRAALSRLADAKLLPHLIRDHGARERGVFALAAAAWLLAVAALAGPAWQRQPAPLYANGAARVIAFSLSDDMRAQDVKPDRMTRARFAVNDLLDAAGDARTALIGYAGDAFVVAPLTSDKATVLNLLQALDPDVMPAPGNDAARAIAQSLDSVAPGARAGRRDRAGHGRRYARCAVGRARRERSWRARGCARHRHSRRARRFRRSMAASNATPRATCASRACDESALRALANAGGGTYASLGANGDGVALIGAPSATRSVAASRQQANLWRDAGAWLLLPLLPLAALAFRRGWVCVLALCFIVPQTRAATWQNLWSRPDQQALRAMHGGDYAHAQQLAQDAQLRGAAAYRQGDYDAAATEFARGDGAQAQYDLGNALAKGGKYQDALAAYDRALQRDPALADAHANRQAVQDWLKQHPLPPQPKNADGAQGNEAKSQRGGGKNRQSAKGSSGQPNGDGQDGQSLAQNPRAQAGDASGSARESGNADSAKGKAQNGDQRNGDTGASLAEDDRQREQAQRARRALQQALAQRGAGAQHAGGKPQGAYALGAEASDKRRQVRCAATRHAGRGAGRSRRAAASQVPAGMATPPRPGDGRRQRRPMKTRLLWWFAFLVFATAAWAAPNATAPLHAFLDRTQAAPGETVTLNIEGADASSGAPDLSPLQQDFDVLGTSSSSKVEIVNGVAKSSTQLGIALRPRHAGTLTIPSLQIGRPAIATLDPAGERGAVRRPGQRGRPGVPGRRRGRRFAVCRATDRIHPEAFLFRQSHRRAARRTAGRRRAGVAPQQRHALPDRARRPRATRSSNGITR